MYAKIKINRNLCSWSISLVWIFVRMLQSDKEQRCLDQAVRQIRLKIFKCVFL